MENAVIAKIIELNQDAIVDHIKGNFHLLKLKKAEIGQSDYKEETIRRLSYRYKLFIDNKWYWISYDLELQIMPDKDDWSTV